VVNSRHGHLLGRRLSLLKRSQLFLLGKSLLAVAILAAVGWQFAKILKNPQLWEQPLTIRYEYLALAGLLYLIPHTLWGTYFYWLLKAQDAQLTWFQGVRAYYVSQFGKYVPGKAWVFFLRVMMLRQQKVPAVAVGVTATFETLTSMGAGALIGVSLLPWIGVDFGLDSGHYFGLLLLAGSPIGLGLLVFAASRITRKSRFEQARQIKSPPFWLLFVGLLFTSLGWLPLGLSLWATVQAVSPEEIPLTFERYLSLLGTVAVSYVAGFIIVLSPGGLGTREFILQRVLTLQLTPILGSSGAGIAVVVTLLLRLVWTLFEVVVSGLMWACSRATPKAEESDE